MRQDAYGRASAVTQQSSALRSTWLRPLADSEVTDLSLQVYRQFGLTLLRLTALPALLGFSVVLFTSVFLLPLLFTTSDPSSLGRQAADVLLVLSVVILVALPLALVAFSYGGGVVIKLVMDYLTSRVVDERTAQIAGRSCLGTMVRAIFLSTLWVSVPVLGAFALIFMAAFSSTGGTGGSVEAGLMAVLLFLVAPFTLLYAISNHSLAPAISVFENLGARDAIRRSKALLKAAPGVPSGYTSLGAATTLIVFTLLIALGGMYSGIYLLNVPGMIEAALGASRLAGLLSLTVQLAPFYLAIWITLPMAFTSVTILYLDRRIRLEGYDITLLSEEATHAARLGRSEF